MKRVYTLTLCVLSTALMAMTSAMAQTAPAKGNFGADRHAARGIACTSCHGPDMANPQYPDQENCLPCHPKETLAKKTEKLTPNPHNPPHNGECTLCHLQHEPTENYCNQCHQFKMPTVP